MTKDNDTATKPGRPKGTLSLGGTLSVGAGAQGSARPSSGVAVEVRRRRFDTPNPLQQKAKSVTPPSDELKRRMEVLEQARARQDSGRQAQQDALAMASRLQEERVKQASERQEREAAERKAREEAERIRQQEVAISKVGSGAGGVQSGTLSDEARHRAVDARDFTGGKKAIHVNDRKRSGTSARPEARDGTGGGMRKRGRNAYLGELEERARGGRRKVGERREQGSPAEKIIREVDIPEFITVAELASRMAEKSADVVKKLMLMGEMVTANQTIDQDTAELIVSEFGHTPRRQEAENLEEALLEGEDDPKDLKPRPPIVTVMGHVDHGKTTLLDSLRKANVVSGEAGGITQHIGAYQVTAPSGRPITFLDTPGHAAFTAMRARGASVTDVVILVVAADDGIMPQTLEAIQHARAAGVPIVVAINKIDKQGADPQRVKNELLSHDVILEEFGGEVPAVAISALQGTGLGELEEIVLLQADMLDLKANPNRRGDGSVVEARLDKGRGPAATIIVQRGTVKVGDIVVAGSVWGRVRALINDQGEAVKEAGPSMPVEVLGLQGVPSAGDTFVVAEDERRAKEVAALRDQHERERAQASRKMTLENLMEKLANHERMDLNVIIKADVQGSVEALQHALEQLNADQSQVQVKVISGGVGVITENDINLAGTAGAFVVGFNVRADATARTTAERMGVELRYYSIIYNVVDDIKAAMSGLLAPSVQEEVTGQAEIRAIFTFERLKIAGCMVTEGKIGRGSKARIIRDGTVVHNGQLATLRRGKDDVKEVASGFECGITFENFSDFKEGDIAEAYVLKEVKRTIDDLKEAGSKKKQAEEAPTAK